MSVHAHHHHHHPGQPHLHAHDSTEPHPAQVLSWSILRMPAIARLAAALAVSAVRGVIVLLSMR